MEMINTAFQQFGTVEDFLSVNENVVKYGHNSLRYFSQGKPISFGCKLQAFCGKSAAATTLS
jgi:hypothetical protein